MIRIGVVDIDTSHPQSWINVLKEEEKARYVAVFDSGDVWDKEYVKGFAEKNGLEVCSSIEDVVSKVDVGFVQGCDWDRHLERALPFIEAGKPVFIDKPTFGNLRDIFRARKLIKKGAVIFGGSSARYAGEIREFLSQPEEERGEILTVFASTGIANDPFNYSIHGVEMFQGLLGTGVVYTEFVGRNGGAEWFKVSYADGRMVFFQRMTPFHAFAMSVTTTKGLYHIKIETGKIYKALLDTIVAFLEGKKDALADFDTMMESIKIMLAMKKSREHGTRVYLDELAVSDEGYDGKTFATHYKLAKMKQG